MTNECNCYLLVQSLVDILQSSDFYYCSTTRVSSSADCEDLGPVKSHIRVHIVRSRDSEARACTVSKVLLKISAEEMLSYR